MLHPLLNVQLAGLGVVPHRCPAGLGLYRNPNVGEIGAASFFHIVQVHEEGGNPYAAPGKGVTYLLNQLDTNRKDGGVPA